MCDDHHQLLKERGGEREREREGERVGGREGGRERGREGGKPKDLGEDFNLTSIHDRFFLWRLEKLSLLLHIHMKNILYDIPSLNDPEETNGDKTRRGI